ncbi:MAG: LacI family DNA-binding transcriptional regulator [Endozoicomonas sp.]
MANIKDVAKLAGVSISTVSRVVNNSASVVQNKQDAVLRAMAELHYKPNSFAKALVSNRSDTLGLVVGDLADPFFGLMMRGVEKVANQFGKQLLINSGHHDPEQERDAIRSLVDRRCDALIIHSKALTDYHVMELLDSQPASVLINRRVQGVEDRCVYLDNRAASSLAVNHLLKNGHRRIAFLSRDSDIEDQQERLQGYQDALIAGAIIPDSALVARGQADHEGGYHATMELLGRKTDFTAICAYNDAMAAGCLIALRERKVLVPNDISVIGFDDVLLARFLHPCLTTIKYPVEAMGTAAAKLALSVSGEQIKELDGLRFEPELIVRDSARAL